jgi:hypothetical protein
VFGRGLFSFARLSVCSFPAATNKRVQRHPRRIHTSLWLSAQWCFFFVFFFCEGT